MSDERQWHRFRVGETLPRNEEWSGSVSTGEAVVAVAVKMTNGEVNYFLTLGKPFHHRRLDQIAKWVVEKCAAFALDGTPEAAEVCYSLRDAAAEPYFYEQHLQLLMTLASIRSESDRERTCEELENGNHLYFLGSRKQREKSRAKYWSMK